MVANWMLVLAALLCHLPLQLSQEENYPLPPPSPPNQHNVPFTPAHYGSPYSSSLQAEPFPGEPFSQQFMYPVPYFIPPFTGMYFENPQLPPQNELYAPLISSGNNMYTLPPPGNVEPLGYQYSAQEESSPGYLRRPNIKRHVEVEPWCAFPYHCGQGQLCPYQPVCPAQRHCCRSLLGMCCFPPDDVSPPHYPPVSLEMIPSPNLLITLPHYPLPEHRISSPPPADYNSNVQDRILPPDAPVENYSPALTWPPPLGSPTPYGSSMPVSPGTPP